MARNLIVLGIGIGIAMVLMGCGDSDDDASTTSPTYYPSEPHTLHLAISSDGFLHEDESYQLHLAGRRYPVTVHDDESRERHPDIFANPNFGLPDMPTHYVDEVPLPTDSITRFHVTQHSDRNGQLARAHGEGTPLGLALVGIHVPLATRIANFNRNSQLGSSGNGCESASNVSDNDGNISADLLNVYSPLDIAKTYIFHQSEMTNFDPDQAANVIDFHIACADGLDQFANTIKSVNSSTGGWYDMTPVLNDDGTQHTTDDGEPVFNYIMKDEARDSATEALKNAVNAVKNDPALEGDNWNTEDGVSSVDDSDPAAAALQGASSAFNVKIADVGHTYALDVKLEASDDERMVTVSANNNNLTHLGWYVQFLDAAENVLSTDDDGYDWDSLAQTLIPEEETSLLETGKDKFLSLIHPVQTIMGIPTFSEDNRTVVSFPMPVEATYARLIAGGLGTGHNDPTLTSFGATMTSVFELSVPTMLLAAAAAYHDDGAGLRQLFTETSVIKGCLSFWTDLIYFTGSDDLADISERVAVLMGNYFLSKLGQDVFEYYLEQMTLEEIDDGIPFAGWALNAVSISTTATMLIESSSETASTPWTIERTLATTHDIEVTINHDPNNFQFPATATEFTVLASFSGGTPYVKSIPLPGTTVSDPQIVRFNDVPAGGTVDIEVLFFSDTGWLAGQGDAKGVVNLDSFGLDYLAVPITIEERLVPLWDESVYMHKEKLGYDGGAGEHVWIAALDEPPTETIRDLSDSSVQGAMGDLGSISLSQKLGTMGYVWEAFSPTVMPCPGQAASGQLYVFQNISLTEDPETGYMFADCGFSEKPYILYDLLGGQSGARNFVVVPGGDGNYYARKMTYTTTGSFELSTTESFAKFPVRVDSMVYHPWGYLIAINDSSSRMFSASIGDDPVPDAEAPIAVAVAGPATTLEGLAANPALLRDPIALKLAPDDSIMVLDDIHELTQGTPMAQTKARIKVFNTDGTPVPYFADDAYELDIVEVETGEDVFYLDFAVEGQGYIYILSYATPQNTPNYILGPDDYRLDIYEPDGTWLVRTTGVAAARLAVDLWRNVNTLNYETITGPDGRVEPSVSEWIPPTPNETGEPCDVDVACVSNNCDNGVCAGVENGQPCLMDIDCASGNCESAMCSAAQSFSKVDESLGACGSDDLCVTG